MLDNCKIVSHLPLWRGELLDVNQQGIAAFIEGPWKGLMSDAMHEAGQGTLSLATMGPADAKLELLARRICLVSDPCPEFQSVMMGNNRACHHAEGSEMHV